MSAKNRTALQLADKGNIVKMIENGTKMVQIALEYGVNKATISRI